MNPPTGTYRLSEVIAHLAAPVVLSEEFHLDGLLASAHPLCRSSPCGRDTPAEALVAPPVPCAALTVGGARAHLCTAADAAVTARLTTTHALKRRDAIDVAELARPINLGLGPGKNRMHKLPTIVTPTLTWWAVADRRGLVRALNRITHVGQWRSAGYGLVSRWEVVTHHVERPERVLVDADGRAQRTLPVSWTEWSETTTHGALQAPYWHPARQGQTIVPVGARCVVRQVILDEVRRLADAATQIAHRKRHEARGDARRAARVESDG